MKSFVIVSAEKTTNTPAENDRATMQLLDFLERTELEFTKVHGMYNGTREVSFLVILPFDSEARRAAYDSITKYAFHALHQDSVLFVDGDDGHAELITDLMGLHIGTWHNVSEVDAKAHGAYTQIGELFYVAK